MKTLYATVMFTAGHSAPVAGLLAVVAAASLSCNNQGLQDEQINKEQSYDIQLRGRQFHTYTLPEGDLAAAEWQGNLLLATNTMAHRTGTDQGSLISMVVTTVIHANLTNVPTPLGECTP